MGFIVQDCGEWLQRKFFVPVIMQFRNCFRNYCQLGFSVVTMLQLFFMEFIQKQSISASEYLILNTHLMNIQLNTWIQALARSNLCHLSWKASEDVLTRLLTLHTSMLEFQCNDRQCRHRRLSFRKYDPACHALNWAPSLSKLRLFLLSNGKFLWISE